MVEINVAPEQLDDRVDEAIQLYQEYHTDATFEHYRKHKVTQIDLDNEYITLPEDLIYVSRLLPIGHIGSTNEFSLEYQLRLEDVYNLISGSIIDFAMAQMYRSTLDMVFDNGNDQKIRFNRHLNRLYIDGGLGEEFNLGDWMIIEGYSAINPNTYPDIYNDMFLKRYLTALIKKNWGTNMKKFTGMQLPGGIEINGQTIYDEAVEEIKTIEETMQKRYEFPPMMAIG